MTIKESVFTESEREIGIVLFVLDAHYCMLAVRGVGQFTDKNTICLSHSPVSSGVYLGDSACAR
jgi:hypothetical protein